jgi:hypothetical protein
MGFRVSWIARTGYSTEELLSVLGHAPSGERDEFADVGHYLLEMPGNDPPCVLLIASGTDHFMDLRADHAEMLSRDDHECIYFVCSDTVMITELRSFRDGKEAWSIVYNCSDETMQPAMHGDVPEIAHTFLRDLQAKEAEGDGGDYLYELTGDVGQYLVGFRHDRDLVSDDPAPFQHLGSRR